jgi:hypothetical protein
MMGITSRCAVAQGPHFKPSPLAGQPLGLPGYPSVRRPAQSFEFAGLERVAVDECRSVMLAQRLHGVLRWPAARAAIACPWLALTAPGDSVASVWALFRP